MTNNVNPDQMPHSVASDLGLHCLLKLVCPNIRIYYGITFQRKYDLAFHARQADNSHEIFPEKKKKIKMSSAAVFIGIKMLNCRLLIFASVAQL